MLSFAVHPPNLRLSYSGGQKRRVSLGAALVHSPPLLILDEPTVGVDPLLRQSIWQHLVTLTQTERISVIITTHYIEEARQANLVGLMRHGRILAEDSPDALMSQFELTNLEDVFLKLCVSDSSRHAAVLAVMGDKDRKSAHLQGEKTHHHRHQPVDEDISDDLSYHRDRNVTLWRAGFSDERPQSPGGSTIVAKSDNIEEANSTTTNIDPLDFGASNPSKSIRGKSVIKIHTGTNKIEITKDDDDYNSAELGYTNEAVEVFSSEDDDIDSETVGTTRVVNINSSAKNSPTTLGEKTINYRKLIENAASSRNKIEDSTLSTSRSPDKQILKYRRSESPQKLDSIVSETDEYITMQAIKWAARRNNQMDLMNLKLGRLHRDSIVNQHNRHIDSSSRFETGSNFYQWWKTLMAVTWKNYVRLRRNPPVLVFQFMLPAVQVILFCLCIGGEPFDVPVAIVNDEVVPKSSLQFLNGLNKKIIRQVKYDNLSSAINAVKRGDVWGAIHIPDKYSEHLQSRLIMGEEVTNETISNGTIKVYPDLTSKYKLLPNGIIRNKHSNYISLLAVPRSSFSSSTGDNFPRDIHKLCA